MRHGASLTMAAMGIPWIAQSRVVAGGAPGPNEQIAVGAIGVGRQGSGLAAAIANSKDARLLAVADLNLPRAQEIRERLGAEAAYQDYHELLARDDIDAIVTATVDHWRALVCIHACQAGKDVYAEKPMTLTIREGRVMVAAVRKYERVFQTGSQQRSMAPNRLGCELIRNGRIGKVQKVIASNYPSPWECALPEQPVPEGIDWDLWCGPTEPAPFNQDLYTPRANPGWISFRTYSGGEMTGWGSHGFDQVQWALGMDESGPIRLWTEGEPFNPPTYEAPEGRARGEKTCREPKVFLEYADDIVMELGNGSAGGATFIGEDGTITIDRNRCVSDPEEIAQEPIGEDDLRLYESTNHMQNWLDCIRSREKPIADVEIGHRSSTVCHLGNIARWAGRELQWDSEEEQFVDDEDANGYVDRVRRAPYELPAIEEL
jgi:predicted dehydrogenase